MKTKKPNRKLIVLMTTCIAFISDANAESSYSPYVVSNYPANVYWGDTHLHTSMSTDAYGMGNRILKPDDAYRFAKGGLVLASNGQSERLHLPLDFLVVSDHAENMGVMSRLQAQDPALLKTVIGKQWYQRMLESPLVMGDIVSGNRESYVDAVRTVMSRRHKRGFFWGGFFAAGETGLGGQGTGQIGSDDFRRSVWEEVVANADLHNEPGKFTAFSGFEWTGDSSINQITSADGEYHRVVIFKDDVNRVTQVLPFSRLDSRDPEKLWHYFAAYEEMTGGEVLAILHNSNISNGQGFSLLNYQRQPLNATYAKLRNRWEPLVEVSQIKGDSETHPVLSPADEFADYETWGNWISNDYGSKKIKYEYARSGLKLGLQQQFKLGVNPFKFGMIGSTDAHTSLTAVAENNFWGKSSLSEPGPHRMRSNTDAPLDWRYSASGYAAVWAQENTREALFAAMKRKEVYASTGPRITVRFFGGWEYEADDAFKPNLAQIGYEKGVPMGGDLTNSPEDKTPSFLIRAVRDPDGANLDRVQVIKGWRSIDGELHEKIHNVALSDNRKPNWRGKVKPVGSTVDIPNASYTNSMGDPEPAVVWQDPDFKKEELAFYYVRVLEIPTPRWTAYDAKYFGIKNIPKEVPMVTQERAYTSPIWYAPAEVKIRKSVSGMKKI